MSENAQVNPFQESAAVSKCVQLLELFITDSKVKLKESPFEVYDKMEAMVTSVDREISIQGEEKYLFVDLGFSLVARGKRKKIHFYIKPIYRLIYRLLDHDVDFTESQLEFFSRINAVYNAWPYLREYADDTMARMRLNKRSILPVFRANEFLKYMADIEIKIQPKE